MSDMISLNFQEIYVIRIEILVSTELKKFTFDIEWDYIERE